MHEKYREEERKRERERGGGERESRGKGKTPIKWNEIIVKALKTVQKTVDYV